MSFKDILAIVTAADGEEGVIAAAEALAIGEAKTTALLFEIEPSPVIIDVPYGYMSSEVWAEIAARAHEGFCDEESKLKARLSHAPRPWVVRTIAAPSALIGVRAAAAARCCDVAIMARPESEARKSAFEGVLFGSGRPVLVVAPDWKGGRLGRNIVVGWNGKREAARALADAGPLTDRADLVTIVTVNGGSTGDGPSAADAAEHLARRGREVKVRQVEGAGRDEGAALLEECTALGADLLVLGGYGRPRLQEMIFGGVTREALKSARIPLFMAH